MIPWDWMQFVRSCSNNKNIIKGIDMNFEDLKKVVIRKKGTKKQTVLISEMHIHNIKKKISEESFMCMDMNCSKML